MENNKKKEFVSHRISHNNLHIKCTALEQPQVSTVMRLVQQFHTHCDRIFIDVRDLSKPGSSVAQSFKKALSSSSVSPQQIIFKGAGGFDLAINGNRVLVNAAQKQDNMRPKGHICCGRCKNCHCHGHD